MKKEVETWWAHAQRDYQSAQKNFQMEDYYESAFLSQQSVEKALKALLIHRTDAFPKIHDLVEL